MSGNLTEIIKTYWDHSSDSFSDIKSFQVEPSKNIYWLFDTVSKQLAISGTVTDDKAKLWNLKGAIPHNDILSKLCK